MFFQRKISSRNIIRYSQLYIFVDIPYKYKFDSFRSKKKSTGHVNIYTIAIQTYCDGFISKFCKSLWILHILYFLK